MAAPARKVTELKKPRAIPNFNGVPGELVSLDGLNLTFGKTLRTSPYDGLLDQLAAAGAGKALRFGDVRAKTSLYARAKKKLMRVSFAEVAGVLYVRFDGSEELDIKATRRTRILKALKLRPMTAMQLASAGRNDGDSSIDAQLVEAILTQMHRDDLVIKREGDTWGINPKAVKA